MGHSDALKWWDSLNVAQKKHIQKIYGNPTFGFSKNEKSNFMKQYQNDQQFNLLKTGDRYKSQTQSSDLTDWTTFINNNE